MVTDLITEYTSILNSGNTDILTIMRAQSKRDQADAIRAGTPLVDIITTTNYYLTIMDFFILSRKYNLSLIVLCRTKIPTTASKYISFINGQPEQCYVIFAGSFALAKSNTPPTYGVLSRDESIRLNVSRMESGYNTITKLNITTIEAYIARAKLAAKLGKRVRKKAKITVKTTGKPRVIKRKGKISIKVKETKK